MSRNNGGVQHRKSKRTVRAIYRYYHYLCQYCFKVRPTTFDHIVPKAAGGTNELGNLIPACAHCNERKGSIRRNPRKEAELLARALGAKQYVLDWHVKLSKRNGRFIRRALCRKEGV